MGNGVLCTMYGAHMLFGVCFGVWSMHGVHNEVCCMTLFVCCTVFCTMYYVQCTGGCGVWCTTCTVYMPMSYGIRYTYCAKNDCTLIIYIIVF